jgi:hypothetical protein
MKKVLVGFSSFLMAASASAVAAERAAQAGGEASHLIFEQPSLRGVRDNFHVPLAEHGYPHDKPFNLILWQPNPNRPDGQLVPSSWKAGDLTGFYPGTPIKQHQASFRDEAGSSTVQADGSTVGAYINSADLTNGSGGSKMMITPAYMFAESERFRPFQRKDRALVNSLKLQVPTARDENKSGNFTYVVVYFVLQDVKSRTQISYGVTLFHHDPRHAKANFVAPKEEVLKRTEVGGYDDPSHSYMVGNMLAPGSRVVTPLFDSSLFQVEPWRGWRTFDFAITYTNFERALNSLKNGVSGFQGSDDPSDYVLTEWHLNAELKYSSGSAELGWSLQDSRVTLMSNDSLKPLGVHQGQAEFK